MTTKAKGAGKPPPAAADDVRALLLKHLGDGAPVNFIEIQFLVRQINRAVSTGQLPIHAHGTTWTTHPDTRAIYESERTLARLLPSALLDRQVTLTELRTRAGGRPYPELDAFEEQSGRWRRLLDAVNAAIPDIPNPHPALTRKQDVRSEWHPTARMFAGVIEDGYQRAGTEPPTRLSLASPLVFAVEALLGLIGMKRGGQANPDAFRDDIRKALGKYRP